MHPIGSTGTSYFDSAASEDLHATKTAFHCQLWVDPGLSRPADVDPKLPVRTSSFTAHEPLKLLHLNELVLVTKPCPEPPVQVRSSRHR